mgnify:FL=1|tara:strand:+ start:309 stop:1028 length:720 start_codon:yes stop_codon:yes gene_type:complete
MTKKTLNQNGKYVHKFEDFIEPDYIFSKKPINRFKIFDDRNFESKLNKVDQLSNLKDEINTIEDCNLKINSRKLVMGEGKINSPLMLIGETPGKIEDDTGKAFQGEIGSLLKKMLLAINIRIDEVYLTYSINYRTPDDRKPTAQEIRRYSIFLKQHISIINPRIIILMGSTAMEAVTGSNEKISNERGKWKEIILENKTIPIIITYSPSFLIKFPEYKKYSWEDLKKIKKKLQDLNINI